MIFPPIWSSLIVILTAIVISDGRKLILSENSGMLRRNVLYVTESIEASRTFSIVCQAPSDVKSTTLIWVPTPVDTQGSISGPGFNSTLTLKNSGDSFMEFNCTSTDSLLEPTRLRYYRRNGSLVFDKIDNFINSNVSNAMSIKLNCRPPVQMASATMIWYLDDKQILSNSTRVKFENISTSLISTTLTILTPGPQDVGVYMCRVQENMNLLAFYNVTGNMTVQQRDVANATGAYVDITEGDTLKLLFSIHGNPVNSSSLRWKRTVGDKGEIINDEFFKNHPEYGSRLLFNPNTEGPNAELELRNVTKNDKADFTLIADNVYGTSSYTTTVRINQKGSGCAHLQISQFFSFFFPFIFFIVK